MQNDKIKYIHTRILETVDTKNIIYVLYGPENINLVHKGKSLQKRII